MKRLVKTLTIIALLASIISGCSSNNNNEEPTTVDTREKNYLGGYGTFKHNSNAFGDGIIYDDEYIYLKLWGVDYLGAFSLNDGSYRPVCVDASCTHDTSSCKQNVSTFGMRTYFAFNNKLYYVLSNKDIYDAETGEKIYTLAIPEELQQEEDSDRYRLDIWQVEPIDDKYLMVSATNYCYVLDKDFKEVYWHRFGENCRFKYIDDAGNYYYTRDYCWYKVNLSTGTEEVLPTEEGLVCADMTDTEVFYSNTFAELLKYDLITGESTLIKDSVYQFICDDKYIYYVEARATDNEEGDYDILVIDSTGKQISKINITTASNSGSTTMHIIDNKLCIYDNSKYTFTLTDLSTGKQIVTDVSFLSENR